VFTGNYERTLDGKGRLVLPPKHRAKLPEGGYLTPHAGCLALWPAAEFQAMLGRMTEQVRHGQLDRTALMGISSSAEEVELDAQGRIGLPPRLRAFAGLDADVVVAGAVDHVQIWSKPRWSDESPSFTDSAVAAFADGKGI
jgi:MraZ protein